MKKILVMLALGLGITFSANAQKGNKGDGFTVDQKTELKIKHMILKLDLNDSQVNQIKPLIKEKIVEREAMKKKRKAMKDSNKEISSDERFNKANQMLDKKIAFRNKMKQILTAEQMVKLEKMHSKREKKGRKGMKGESCEGKKACEGKGKSCDGK